MKIILLGLIVILASCSFKKNNQTQQGHSELYSEPNSPKSFSDSSLKRIVIASTNDIEARYSPTQLSFSDKHTPGTQSIKIGGVDIIGSYFNILREEYKNVLLLDSGDLFSGDVLETKFVHDFYSLLKYDALTVGLGDFNLKLPKNYSSSSSYFKDFAKNSDVPLLLSNLYELKTARVVEWKGSAPYLLKEIDGVKVGVIGLIPDDITKLTPVDNRVGFFVESMLQSTLRHSRLLRSLGAEIVVVLTHQGIKCGEKLAEDLKLPIKKVNFDPRKSGVCEFNDELGEYLKRLPPNLVDVVIGGRTQDKMANFYNDILVMGGFEHGQSFNYAEFYFDSKTKKLVKEKTVVHQPVLFCKEFFKETKDCYTEDSSINHKDKIPATFLGKPVESDAKLKQKFSEILEPKVTQNEKKPAFWSEFVQRSTGSLNADIAFFPSKKIGKNSQLILIEVKGSDLFKILEADFNEEKADNWSPSPFQLKEDSLHVKITGEKIDSQKNYYILSDLEGLQTHTVLKKWISKPTSKVLMSYSWNELAMSDLDSVELRAAAPIR